MPSGTAERLSDFANVIAAAISSAEARDDLRRLVDEQSALRRVAELVAHGAGEDELFNAVAAEAARLIGTRARPWSASTGRAPTRSSRRAAARHRSACRSRSPKTTTGRPPRSFARIAPRGATTTRSGQGRSSTVTISRKGSSVSVPILVSGRLWGMLGTLTENRRLPAGTEARLEKFAELIAAAMANSQARAEVQLLADEQTALRRIAELVAHGAAEAELFEAVAIEASGLVGERSDDARALRGRPGLHDPLDQRRAGPSRDARRGPAR